MTLESVYDGEDVPIVATYDDGATDPDDQDADGDADAFITITENSTGTAVVSSVEMTKQSTGTFEHVWDTAANANGPGVYIVKVEADFGSETKIVKDRITVT